MFSPFGTLYKSILRLFTFAALLPHFRKLSGAFRILACVRKLYCEWMLLRSLMLSGCVFDANVVLNYCVIPDDRQFFTRYPMLAVSARRGASYHYGALRQAISHSNELSQEIFSDPTNRSPSACTREVAIAS